MVTSVTLIRSRSTHKYAFLFVCFSEYTWQLVVLTSDSLLLLCVCVCIYLQCVWFSECTLQLVAWLSASPRYRALYLSNNQLSALEPGVFAGLLSLQWVCVFLVAEYWDLPEWQCCFSINTWHAFAFVPSFACVCVCIFLCHGVHRQTNSHSGDISEIVPAHTHALVQRWLAHPWAAVVTSMTLIRSRSLYTHTYTDTQVCMFVCLFAFLSTPDSWLSYLWFALALVCLCMNIFVLFLFSFLSAPYSWLPDSLLLLDTGSFICPTTSCRSWNPVFLPGFHRFSECVCF